MSSNQTLEELRRQIDAIDDRVHDLLIERSGMIEQIVAAKGDGRAKLRPGREALIARRLIDRHRGQFPPASLIRIWREIINAFTCMQGPFEIAVPKPAVDTLVWEATRDYFGGTPARRAMESTTTALRAVADGEATLAMLPWGAGRTAWVGDLLALDDPGLRVCYGLPFVRGTAGETTVAV
ncbi:MAG: chorismate mutase, partial [Inquilinus sp.]|nr:chorismate mutase [Inquilinus sp.]